MRVIGGLHRSRKLKEVDSDKTRETRDAIKESMFNTLSQDIIEATVLDLFAGSGSLGIEALSRGARFCQFVDIGYKQVSVIKENITQLKLERDCTISKQDYKQFLLETNQTYDVILLDPPYELKVIEDCLKIIENRKLLTENGVIACLYSKNDSLKLENFDIISYKHKKKGVTNMTYLKWGI